MFYTITAVIVGGTRSDTTLEWSYRL